MYFLIFLCGEPRASLENSPKKQKPNSLLMMIVYYKIFPKWHQIVCIPNIKYCITLNSVITDIRYIFSNFSLWRLPASLQKGTEKAIATRRDFRRHIGAIYHRCQDMWVGGGELGGGWGSFGVCQTPAWRRNLFADRSNSPRPHGPSNTFLDLLYYFILFFLGGKTFTWRQWKLALLRLPSR